MIMDSHTPAIGADGTIYVAADKALFALDPGDGSIIWSVDTGRAGTSRAPVIGSDGTIYVGGMGFYAVNPDGSLKWHWSNQISQWREPAIGQDGTVYVTAYLSQRLGVLAALDPETGDRIWTAEYHEPSAGISLGHDGTIYVVSRNQVGKITGPYDSYLHAFDPETRTEKWRFKARGDFGFVNSASICADGTTYIVDAHDVHYMYALNPDGTIKWQFKHEWGHMWDSVSIGPDGTLYAGSENGFFIAVNPDGTFKWIYRHHGYMPFGELKAAIDKNGTIYTGCWSGDLYAFDWGGGVKWRLPLFDKSAWFFFSPPVIAGEELIYIFQ